MIDGPERNPGQSAGRIWAHVCKGAARPQPRLLLPIVLEAALGVGGCGSARSPTFLSITESPAVGVQHTFLHSLLSDLTLNEKNLCSYLSISSHASCSLQLSQSKAVGPPHPKPDSLRDHPESSAWTASAALPISTDRPNLHIQSGIHYLPLQSDPSLSDTPALRAGVQASLFPLLTPCSHQQAFRILLHTHVSNPAPRIQR